MVQAATQNPTSVDCRYFLLGQCRNGAACPFRHDPVRISKLPQLMHVSFPCVYPARNFHQLMLELRRHSKTDVLLTVWPSEQGGGAASDAAAGHSRGEAQQAARGERAATGVPAAVVSVPARGRQPHGAAGVAKASAGGCTAAAAAAGGWAARPAVSAAAAGGVWRRLRQQQRRGRRCGRRPRRLCGRRQLFRRLFRRVSGRRPPRLGPRLPWVEPRGSAGAGCEAPRPRRSAGLEVRLFQAS